MFYQNNNDYMRDAFYYSQPQNTTYQYNGMNNNGMNNAYMPATNVQSNGMFGQNMNPYMNNSCSTQMSMDSMYPQVYRIINPVAQRVISNNAYQYYTEDNINNMVDTVYNIVEGDVNTLTSTSTTQVSGDDTVTQGVSRSASQSNNVNNNNNTNTRQVTAESSRSTSSSVTVQTTSNNNQLLRDLIKIIILKELLSRPNNNCGCNNNFNCGMNSMNTGVQNCCNPRCMGMI
ncbi:MAG: hypothetical protein K1W33_01595 [Clostridia bacterium]